MELFESAFGIALKEVYGRQWKERRQDGRVRRRARRVLSDVMMGWEGVRSALDWIRIELDEVAERIPSIMTDYGLSSYDAVHAATAFYVGTADFVTRDSKFALIPARLLNLYVDSRHLRPCRELRAR
ncbi:MAG: PIN domain-containing protein [Actinobacteria bacterium]|nr:PIN domain-containing protein [Actinomycetota bacterium]